MASETWVIERHTDDKVWCWRARNVYTDETRGFRLTEVDAARLAEQLNGH